MLHFKSKEAVLAQPVERVAFNHVVVGSIPTDGGRLKNKSFVNFYYVAVLTATLHSSSSTKHGDDDDDDVSAQTPYSYSSIPILPSQYYSKISI